MSDWWRAIEDELDARSVDAPDPWGDLPYDEAIELTDEQQRFLLSLADQPAVPRLDVESHLAADSDGELDDRPDLVIPDEEWDG